jgi:hypothetical protein
MDTYGELNDFLPRHLIWGCQKKGLNPPVIALQAQFLCTVVEIDRAPN